MWLHFPIMVNKIYAFFSLHISTKMLFTKHRFSFKFVLSILSKILDMLKSFWSIFSDLARSIIAFAIPSAVLLQSRELVPNGEWNGLIHFLKRVAYHLNCFGPHKMFHVNLTFFEISHPFKCFIILSRNMITDFELSTNF